MKFSRLVRILLRYLQFFPGTVLVLETIHLHFQYIDERIEPRTRIYRKLNLHYLIPESLFKGIHSHVPILFFMIQLIYGYDKGFLMFFGMTRHDFRSHFHALGGIYQHNTGFGYRKSGINSSHEIIRTRSIYDIELIIQKLGI